MPGEAGPAVVATLRFGFAARPGELAEASRDPRGWVAAQLRRSPEAPDLALPAAEATVAKVLAARRDGKEGKQELKEELRRLYVAEVADRTARAAGNAPFVERLVQFWGNHFTVSGRRPLVAAFAPAFEREAIRPHVLGRFSDMLLAATRHPAMLFYLDNVQSFGPGSPIGRRRGRGLNENLGRELLELHTLGVDGGYGQQDVGALARILTGWSVARVEDPHPGSFRFLAAAHEPGPKTLLGRLYPEGGAAEGEAALRDLARHPATARHVATRLLRHFVEERPDGAAVARLARVFRATEGDLAALAGALLAEEAAWRPAATRVRPPVELVTAAFRATGTRAPPGDAVVNALKALDQPAFLAPSPAGWPDDSASWLSPEAALRRIEWCQGFAARLPDPPDPAALADGVFGAALAADTSEAIRHAPDRRTGLALLLASPGFQKR